MNGRLQSRLLAAVNEGLQEAVRDYFRTVAIGLPTAAPATETTLLGQTNKFLIWLENATRLHEASTTAITQKYTD